MADANPLQLSLYHPRGCLSASVQALWVASASESHAVEAWLPGDIGSGIVFNLTNTIAINQQPFETGVILQPVSKDSALLAMPAGSVMAGMRFHPAVGYGVMNRLCDTPTPLVANTVFEHALLSLFKQLSASTGPYAKMNSLYRWLKIHLRFSEQIPPSLASALNALSLAEGLNPDTLTISQRQLERQFQRWLGVTPKQAARILRVKRTREALKQSHAPLVDIALSQGFSDQAHMTREFKQIAKVTPYGYVKRVRGRYSE
ncbi:helix-turn-helix domain-containing protein [Thaumasiovibrio subtropicus]|uniref:helix-turn-helix domain-containing protein n=1 Tax=Thaumasiovibrio subtropicus TaxID=1891207 RepID=UPI000B35C8D3|nr:helix-turn-helix domain-containing protein [Thaumasiovibrio subtropicus]